jgi:membrane protein YqaA with SNARE-associated domain
MAAAQLIEATPSIVRNVGRLLYWLGALGFIPLGILDHSVVPIPGSMDAMTIVLSARQPQLWFYYAVMATIGSLVGAFITFRLARKGGQKGLARWISKKAADKAEKSFMRWGFGAIAIPALLPPPVPMLPFVVVAGTMQYSVNKFLAAIAMGRIVRYGLLAFIAATYGRRVVGVFIRQDRAVIIALIVVVVGVSAILWFLHSAKGLGNARG